MSTFKIFEGIGKNLVTEIELENGIIKFPFSIQQTGHFSELKNTLLTDCSEGFIFFVEKEGNLVKCGDFYISMKGGKSLKIETEAIGRDTFLALPQEIGRMLVYPFNSSYTNSKEYFQKSLLENNSTIENAIVENKIPQDLLKYAEKLVLKMKKQLEEN